MKLVIGSCTGIFSGLPCAECVDALVPLPVSVDPKSLTGVAGLVKDCACLIEPISRVCVWELEPKSNKVHDLLFMYA